MFVLLFNVLVPSRTSRIPLTFTAEMTLKLEVYLALDIVISSTAYDYRFIFATDMLATKAYSITCSLRRREPRHLASKSVPTSQWQEWASYHSAHKDSGALNSEQAYSSDGISSARADVS
jgi:hypothetical protein